MASPIIKSIKARILYNNKNWLAAIVGETGSGKSFSALRIAKLIDPSFNIDRVVFTPEQFLELLNSGTLTRGCAVVFDEAGCGMPAREWYSIQNKLLGYVLQTFRRENLAVIFTLPNISFLDVQARKLFHTIIQTLSVNFKKKYVVTKYFLNQSNPVKDKDYRKFLRIRNNSGAMLRVSRYLISKPNDAIIEKYEAKKKVFANDLKLQAQEALKKKKEKKEPKIPKSVGIENDLRLGHLSMKDIALKYRTTYQYIKNIKMNI